MLTYAGAYVPSAKAFGAVRVSYRRVCISICTFALVKQVNFSFSVSIYSFVLVKQVNFICTMHVRVRYRCMYMCVYICRERERDREREKHS
jgi:hypothetical protein